VIHHIFILAATTACAGCRHDRPPAAAAAAAAGTAWVCLFCRGAWPAVPEEQAHLSSTCRCSRHQLHGTEPVHTTLTASQDPATTVCEQSTVFANIPRPTHPHTHTPPPPPLPEAHQGVLPSQDSSISWKVGAIAGKCDSRHEDQPPNLALQPLHSKGLQQQGHAARLSKGQPTPIDFL
jgi:hypothetical protein